MQKRNMKRMQFFVVLLICIQYVNGLPLQDCKSDEVDVILYVGTINPLQKVRIKNIINLFLPDSGDPRNIRLAVFRSSGTSEPVIGFNDYKSSIELLHQIDQLLLYNLTDFQKLEQIHTDSMAYIVDNASAEDNKSNVVTVLCEACIWSTIPDVLTTNNNGLTDMYLILDEEVRIARSHFQMFKNIEFVSPTDTLATNQFISLTLCGKCNKGWVLSKTELGFSYKTCYKLKVAEKLVSWNEASSQCKSLNSQIVSLKNADELEFLKNLTSNYMKEHDFSAGRYVFNTGQCQENSDDNLFNQWHSRTPVIFGNGEANEIPQRLCSAVDINFNQSGIQFSWAQLDADLDIAKLIMCEFRMSARSNHDGSNDKKISFLNNNIKSESSQNIKLFDCFHNSEKIPFSLVFDGHYDCTNKLDEYSASRTHCVNAFYCTKSATNFACIDKEKRCDGFFDCPENDDEENCDGCMETMLNDGTCLPSQWFYKEKEYFLFYPQHEAAVSKEGIKLVEDFLESCNKTVCELPAGTTHKLVIQKCSFEKKRLDLNKSEEKQRFTKQESSWAARCVYLRDLYSGQALGCSDLLHLNNCAGFVCPDGFFKCRLSYCVPFYMVNDGSFDCLHDDDESTDNYEKIFSPSLFKCRKSRVLVHPAHVCDGIDHCPTGDDELHCYKACPAGFTCQYGVTAVTDHSKVNHLTLFQNIDRRTKVIDLSGIDLNRVQLEYQSDQMILIEMHVSNCSLNDILFRQLAQALQFAIFGPNLLDFSFNSFHPEICCFRADLQPSVPIYRLNATHTNLKTFKVFLPMEKTFPIVLDFSYTELQILEFQEQHVTSESFIDYINLSHSKLENFVFVNDYRKSWSVDHKNLNPCKIVIGILDLRNTKIEFNAKIAATLKKITISSSAYGDNFKLCCGEFAGGGFSSSNCQAPTDPISSCSNLLGNVVRTTYFFLVGLTGITGNVVVVIFRILTGLEILKHGELLAATCLGFSDLFMSLSVMLPATADVYYRDSYVLYDTEWRDSSLCQIGGFLASLSYITSAVFVFMSTVDLHTKLQDDQHTLLASRCVRVTSVAWVWCLSITAAIIPVLFPAWHMYSSNALCLGLPFYINHPVAWVFSFTLHIVFTFLVMICTILVLVLIFKTLFSSSDVTLPVYDEDMLNDVKTQVLLVVSNILCWFPVWASGFLTVVGVAFSPQTVGWITLYLLPTLAVVHPLLILYPVASRKWEEFKNGKNGTKFVSS